MIPPYSVCITHYNNVETAEESLSSIIGQIDDRFEVVVVDQGSTDGSLKILESLEQRGKIRLYRQKVRNRGLGRQLAFAMSKGGCIIANMDTDDVYEPRLGDLLSVYEAKLQGLVFRAVNDQKRGAVTIAPRAFVEEIGGWPDLEYLEDRWIWGVAAERGIYRWGHFPLYARITESRDKRGFFQRGARIYVMQRDRVRIGTEAHVSRSTWPLFPFAYLRAKTRKPISRPIFKMFWPDDPNFCADGLVKEGTRLMSRTGMA